MKYILSIAALACAASLAGAQELVVSDFHEDSSDLSAVVHQVSDYNGDPCALVKVGLAVEGATFEGDIIKSEYKSGEYWVYFTQGANWINVMAPGYTPLRYDSGFGPLNGNTTYVMVLKPESQGLEQGADIIPIELPAKGGGVSIGGRKTTANKPVKFNMVKVKSGSFKMGATPEQNSAEADETPVHNVRFSRDFYIGETEVSQALWQYVMDINPSTLVDDSENLPVESITWDEAQEFCKRLSGITGVTFRLPSEAEWEYAARGGHKQSKTVFSGGNVPDDLAWYEENASGRTHDVKSKQPNELGLYNMSGNVWELCEDYKNDYPKEDVINYICTKPGKNKNRVRRGGSFETTSVNDLRVAFRRRMPQDARDKGTGLRVVMDY